MTNATEATAIRELTADEIATVSGGAAENGPGGIVVALAQVSTINPPAIPPTPVLPPNPVFGSVPGSLITSALFTEGGT